MKRENDPEQLDIIEEDPLDISIPDGGIDDPVRMYLKEIERFLCLLLKKRWSWPAGWSRVK